MAKGGFRGGMPGGMGNIMAQAQKMQKDIERVQIEINALRIDGSSGGGAVKVTIGGDHKVYGISINEDVIDKDDKETLEDLIMAAINQAEEALEQESSSRMGAVTGGVRLPF